MAGATADGLLSGPTMSLLVVAVAGPPLSVVWHELSDATVSGPFLLGATLLPLAALAVGLVAIAGQVGERSDLDAVDRD